MTENSDIGAADRKKDHIELAFKAKLSSQNLDTRFYYEPILSAHPSDQIDISIQLLGKKFEAPIWVSSMTGGTALSRIINKNLAKACGEFGLGMGLGSCRQLLYSDEYLDDFKVRKEIGEQPLYANLGIAQLEQLIDENKTSKIKELLEKLEADGLIIHVNPLQEWLQPEGDSFMYSPLDTIRKCLDFLHYPIIVKEVGQGMGPKSLEALMELPLAAIDFGAAGGTNFALLEIMRSSELIAQNYHALANIGHSADDMVLYINNLHDSSTKDYPCKEIIISGGVSDFLDGYYYTKKLKLPSVYGQASGFLKHAQSSYEHLQTYTKMQIDGFRMAKAMLHIK